MSSEILRLDCDTLVIGAGMAGLVAALRLSGKTLVVTAGLGATAISSGVLASPDRDQEIDRWFLDIMRSSGYPYREGRGLTDLMAVKSGLVPACVDFGEEKPLPVSLDSTAPAGTLTLDIPMFRGRSNMEIAKLVDTDDDPVELLSAALKGIGAPSVILPPVLGITRAGEIVAKIERDSGVRVFEYITAPSVHGLRLLSALRRLADRNRHITILEMTRVDSIEGIVRGHMGTKGKREFTVSASKVVLATGGPLTGLRINGDRVVEPLTGLVVGDAETDLNSWFLSDHPIMYAGTGTKPNFSRAFGELRAAGAVAAGYGLYEALRTGYYVGLL